MGGASSTMRKELGCRGPSTSRPHAASMRRKDKGADAALRMTSRKGQIFTERTRRMPQRSLRQLLAISISATGRAPRLQSAISFFFAGISLIAVSSSSIEPKVSFVPLTKTLASEARENARSASAPDVPADAADTTAATGHRPAPDRRRPACWPDGRRRMSRRDTRAG